jgi:hypothetical protein
MNLRNRVAAECFGTFCLVFGGVGSAVLAGSKIGNVGVALAFGLALLAICRNCDWPGTDAHSFGWNSDYEYVGESGTQHRTSNFRG